MNKKKTMFPNEIIEEEVSMIEQEMINLIDKALKERLIELSLDDITIIARELMPDLDLMVSNKVKRHLSEIGKFMVDKYGDIGE